VGPPGRQDVLERDWSTLGKVAMDSDVGYGALPDALFRGEIAAHPR